MNPYIGLSKKDLQEVMLRNLNELANLRSDSKHLRWRLESTRSALAETQYKLDQIKEAQVRRTVIQFPSQALICQKLENVSKPPNHVASK